MSPSVTASSSTNAVVSEKRWSAMQADLTALGVDGSAMELVSARSVTWPNGALGCPVAGQSYTQGQVSGQQVIVSVGSTQYDYRFGRDDIPVLCQR